MQLLKKGQVTFGSLASIILVVGIAAVIAVVLSVLVADIRADQAINGTAWNISGDALSFFDNLSGQWGLLGTVIGLVLVVSVVLAVFQFKGAGRGGI